jgi:hypothetical protein
MSFRSFVYCCTAWGAAAAGAGWLLGLSLASGAAAVDAGLEGLVLGALLGLALGLVDALACQSVQRLDSTLPRVLFALAAGGVGGFGGGLVGQTTGAPLVGWVFMGVLIGLGTGAFDFLASALRGKDARSGWRKMRNGLLGGAVGGLLGGVAFLVLRAAWLAAGGDPLEDSLWLPGTTSFAVLGGGIGLAVGMSQVLLKGAWLRVESGFGAGRQLILCKPETTIGRAASCDVGLLSDSSLEPVHARIVRRGADYLLDGAAAETFVNDSPVNEPVALHSGDLIRVGRSSVLFLRTRRG